MRWAVLEDPAGELALDAAGRCETNDIECEFDVDE
jgi:hypothetical protein